MNNAISIKIVVSYGNSEQKYFSIVLQVWFKIKRSLRTIL
jgi:hypothetical protein